ncbi:MAG: type VI secretion system membrane subunit TssM [Acidovorax sp.]|nr:type VI secretion system membrane subunit TssM [Acidovorax sp.]
MRIVIGCLLAAVFWWIGPLLTIGVYRPLGWLLLRQVLVGLCLIWAFWPVLVRVWVRLAMSVRHVRPVTPKPKEQPLDSLSRRLRDLDAYLRQHWLKNRSGWRVKLQLRRHAPHRNMHPWFAVIGASGSGKTSMIRRGGLTLKHNADLLGKQTIDDSHTLDCNFWHAGGSIWFDINGHWVEPGGGGDAAGERSEWEAFLWGLKRIKRSPALDGALWCIDCDWLLKSSAEGRKRAAEAMRARLAEMADILGIKLPVYIAVTGLDKLPGSISFLRGIDEKLLEQGFGFGLPVRSGGQQESMFGPVFEELMQKLERRVQEHVLNMAPGVEESRHNVERLQFVENLSVLRRHLTEFLQRSVADSSLTQACQLRGVWMGSSVDLIDGAEPSMLDVDELHLAEYGIRRLPTLWGAVLGQMEQERGLAASATAATGRGRIWSALRWTFSTGVLLLAVGGLLVGYLLERDNLEQVWARFTEGKRLAERQSIDSRPAAALLDVMTQMRYVDDNRKNASELMVTPFWEHVRVADVARETYRKHLRKTLMPELYNYVSSALVSQLQGAPGDTYETLKVYLMLARPERRNADDLVRWMRTQWPKLASEGYSEEDRLEYEGHLRALFASQGLPNTPEDAPLVREARSKAAQLPSVVRVIDRVKTQGLPANIEGVSLARAGGFMAATMLRMRGDLAPTDTAIPAWYTRAGYLDVVKPRLRDAAMAVLEEESWVLRDEKLSGNSFEVEKAAEKLSEATRAQFLQEYIKRWQTFLNDVTVRHYSGMDDAAQIASALIDPQSPLAQLIRFAGRETSLTGNYEGDVDSWIDKQKFNIERGRRAIVGELSGERARLRRQPEHVVEDHFDVIRRLATQMTQTAANGQGNSPLTRLFEPLYRQLLLVNGAMMAGQIMPEYDAFARLRAEAGRQPEPMRGIVLDLVNSGSSASVGDARSIISKSAAGAALAFCNQGLSARYPLKRNAKADVGVQDFESLFGPQGRLAQHFKEHLSNYVDTSTSPWRSKRAEGEQTLVTPDVLRSYESASRIGAATLDGQGSLRISTMVRVVDMDPQIGEVQLDIGDTSIRYAHGSVVNKRVDWTAKPGSNGQLAVRMSVRTVDGRSDVEQFEGPWALFRFFDAGRREGAEADRRETVHQTQLGSVRIEWQALTMPAPLWSNLMQSFSCPG